MSRTRIRFSYANNALISMNKCSTTKGGGICETLLLIRNKAPKEIDKIVLDES